METQLPSMTPTQDPKYSIRGGALVNSATGIEIPRDEPVFILRAKDSNAVAALIAYHDICQGTAVDDQHLAAIMRRIREFQAFAVHKLQRMKTPDTDMSSWPQEASE